MSIRILLSIGLLWVISVFLQPVFAAEKQKLSVSGRVLNQTNGAPVAYAFLVLQELNLQAMSNENGYFNIQEVVEGEWTLALTCLGFEPMRQKITIDRRALLLEVSLRETSLKLPDVTVLAKDGERGGSSSVIDRKAIEHLQSTHLGDLMQLLPGYLTMNPTLNEPAFLTIRETNRSHVANALGTALLIDGAQISNAANLQKLSSAYEESAFPGSAGLGVDMRQFGTDRIESVEVIRGVASTQYGDLNSGAVLVKTRAGVSPFSLNLKTDPRLKSLAIGKGSALRYNRGVVNLDADYAYSVRDLRSAVNAFDRLGLHLAYTNGFAIADTRLLVNMKSALNYAENRTKNDPDKTLLESFTDSNRNVNLSLFGSWLLNRSWLSHIRYHFYGSYGKQRLEEYKEYIGANPTPVTYSLGNGEHEALMLPINYLQRRVIEGQPVYLQGKLSAHQTSVIGRLVNKVMLGVELNSAANEGKGKFGEHMPQGFRERSFRDIPALKSQAFFVENELQLPLGGRELWVQAGLRMTHVNETQVRFAYAMDPRVNLSYLLWRERADRGSYLKLRGAWGIQHKLPTLLHLAPDPVYFDRLSFSYQDADFAQSMVLMSTRVVPGKTDPNLRMPRSRNVELALEGRWGSVPFNLCYFNESLRNAYSFDERIEAMPYRIYEPTAGLPTYEGGVLSYLGQEVAWSADTIFFNYNLPGNSQRVDKWGIEYQVKLGKIAPLRTELVLDGAYMDIKRMSEGEAYHYKSGMTGGMNRKYAALYKGASGLSNGSRTQRLNTNLRAVTHIPRVRMVVSLTTQVVWIDRAQRLSEQDGMVRMVMLDDAGATVLGNIYKDTQHAKYLYPEFLIDFRGNRIPFDQLELPASQIAAYALRATPAYFIADNPRPYLLCNLRLSKEVGDWGVISFYVNNLTNSQPKRYYRSTGIYTRVNPDIYFGADLNFKF